MDWFLYDNGHRPERGKTMIICVIIMVLVCIFQEQFTMTLKISRI